MFSSVLDTVFAVSLTPQNFHTKFTPVSLTPLKIFSGVLDNAKQCKISTSPHLYPFVVPNRAGNNSKREKREFIYSTFLGEGFVRMHVELIEKESQLCSL